MKYFVIFLVLISLSGLVAPQIFAADLVYGLDCEVLHIWNYAIDDCNLMINSINFIFSLLLPISIVIIVSILIALKYKKKF